jgi:hypothetical protein
MVYGTAPHNHLAHRGREGEMAHARQGGDPVFDACSFGRPMVLCVRSVLSLFFVITDD